MSNYHSPTSDSIRSKDGDEDEDEDGETENGKDEEDEGSMGDRAKPKNYSRQAQLARAEEEEIIYGMAYTL